MPSLSVIVPVYNAEATLPLLVQQLEPLLAALAGRYELLLVNDGSRDGSWKVIEQAAAARPWVRGINHANRLLALLRAQVPSEPENPKVNRFNGVHIRFFSKLMLKRLLVDAGFEKPTFSSFDDASVWDVFYAAGHFGHIGEYARKYLPSPFHLRFLQDLWPNIFAKRLRAVATKPVAR